MSEDWGRAEDAEPPPGTARYDQYWKLTSTGSRFSSRPIVIDGLQQKEAKIELAPRIRFVNGKPSDDSYRAVETAATQLVKALTLDQLVLAAVALQVHMRKAKEHLEKKRRLQERWTLLARRMRRLRIEREMLGHTAAALEERRAAAKGTDAAPGLEALFSAEARELAERAATQDAEEAAARAEWSELEALDADLLANAPHFEQSEDLAYPMILVLVAPQGASRRRSPASAMHALIEALQKPLSRTDQMLLEIAFRRCIQAYAPDGDRKDASGFERRLIRAAEKEFAAEFDWARPYVSEASRGEMPSFAAPPTPRD